MPEKPQPEIMFNLTNGELYVGKLALASAIEDGGVDPRDVMPVADVLNNKDIEFDRNSIERTHRPELNKPDMKADATWVNSLVKNKGPKAWVTDRDLVRSYEMGLTLHGKYFRRVFGSMPGLRGEIEEINGWDSSKYSDWTREDFEAYATRVYVGVKKRKPTGEDFQRWFKRGKGPSRRFLKDNYPGGLVGLLESIGFPDTYAWDEDDCIEYGVKILRANPGIHLGNNVYDVLSQRGRGISARGIDLKVEG